MFVYITSIVVYCLYIYMSLTPEERCNFCHTECLVKSWRFVVLLGEELVENSLQIITRLEAVDHTARSIQHSKRVMFI